MEKEEKNPHGQGSMDSEAEDTPFNAPPLS